jgi:hypothetical protein
MFHQSAVGEAESFDWAVLIDDVDDATGVQRIEPEVTYQNCNVGSDLYRGIRPMETHPWHVKHFPCANRFYCPLPRNFAPAKLDAIVVYVVPAGGAVADAPTSGYEKPESFCSEMKRRILSSDGAVRLNT